MLFVHCTGILELMRKKYRELNFTLTGGTQNIFEDCIDYENKIFMLFQGFRMVLRLLYKPIWGILDSVQNGDTYVPCCLQI